MVFDSFLLILNFWCKEYIVHTHWSSDFTLSFALTRRKKRRATWRFTTKNDWISLLWELLFPFYTGGNNSSHQKDQQKSSQCFAIMPSWLSGFDGMGLPSAYICSFEVSGHLAPGRKYVHVIKKVNFLVKIYLSSNIRCKHQWFLIKTFAMYQNHNDFNLL